LRETPGESDLLFKELLIGVTHFFRDPSVWEDLKNNALPLLLATRPVSGVIRAWTAGCSTGEEAYTLAMVLREALDKLEPKGPMAIQIFATDLDPEAIDTARQGVYPAEIATDITPARLERFFVPEGSGYRVSKDIRDLVIFATQNMVMDPPFTKLDILTCRNLLIYLDAELQKKLMPLFHYSLNPGGILVLGSSETVGLATELFATAPGPNRIYRRQNTLPRTELAEFPTTLGRTRSDANANALSAGQQSASHLKGHTDSLLLQHYAPPAVLCTDKGDIVYVSGRTGQFLEPAPGKASLSLFTMAREGLSSALHEVFAKALRQNRPATLLGVRVGGKDSDLLVDVTVHPLSEPVALQGMVLTLFKVQSSISSALELPPTDSTTVTDTRLNDLVRELKQSREELQSTREEMQTSQEELKSTNEELQSTNEELQSTNEELTTSKEELQSMNEELTTVNHELQSKLDELSQASDDMKNLLNSTDIATLFLDDDLNVRRFTNRTTSIIKLIPGDAGRPITDIVTDLDYPAMCEDAREVLRTFVFKERQVPTHDGRWFRVRIMPYRTQDKRIDGVVITFVDVGIAKSKEVALRKALDLIESTQNSAKVQQPEQAPKDAAQVLRDLRELLEQPLIASDTARPVENDKAHSPS
jgi:two-component system CheB/CheR fusion protein